MTTHDTSSTGLTTDDLAGRSPDRSPDSSPESTEPRTDGVHGADDRAQTAQQGEAPYPDLDDRTHQRQEDDAPTTGRPDTDGARLLDEGAAGSFSERWSSVQTRFVDDPRAAVRDADALVAELMQALAERFSQHKSGLEEQWNRGDEPTTESLRLALQQYRSFLDRLLST